MERQTVLVVPTRTTDVDNLPPLPDMQVEVHAIASSTDATILPEPVKWLDVMKALLDENKYNIVHFCGHLADDYLILANEKISVDGLVMMFRRSPPHRKLIVFNTCESVDAARRIATASPCDIIYTYGSIENDKAINFAIKFYSSLRSADTYRQAFDASVGDEKNFGYLEGAGKTSEDDADPNPIVRGGPSDMTLMRVDLNEIKTIMTGGILGHGLVWEVSELKKKVTDWEKYEPVLERLYQASRVGEENSKIWLYVGFAILFGVVLGYISRFMGG